MCCISYYFEFMSVCRQFCKGKANDPILLKKIVLVLFVFKYRQVFG